MENKTALATEDSSGRAGPMAPRGMEGRGYVICRVVVSPQRTVSPTTSAEIHARSQCHVDPNAMNPRSADNTDDFISATNGCLDEQKLGSKGADHQAEFPQSPPGGAAFPEPAEPVH
ncbi:hypothetical protein HPB51_012813 [Rhipicephalus microplus]|uniref:Uncharacterized protein n=1 Tax=Rhipicephalus microplus TaxID=6941 RepID=A0A9J6D9V4_RHIMP|nr:hypothetical protein HPB51_012813 [Rhipicephalus microplus]